MSYRLTDHDKQFGPITYGKSSWNPFRIILSSGDGPDGDGPNKTSLTVYLFGYVFRLFLGQLIKPGRYKVKAGWDENTINRMGRNWYYTYFEKEYGFSYHNGFLQIFYGQQNEMNHYERYDNEGYVTYNRKNEPFKQYRNLPSKCYSMFMPWHENRITEIRHYDEDLKVCFECKNEQGLKFNDYYEKLNKTPRVHFLLKDYDGEIVTASTVIEERVYKKGDRKFKWISLLTKPLIVRSLQIEFSSEMGHEKGSWKGGMTGTSIEVNSRDNYTTAIKKFCSKKQSDKSGSYVISYEGKAIFNGL